MSKWKRSVESSSSGNVPKCATQRERGEAPALSSLGLLEHRVLLLLPHILPSTGKVILWTSREQALFKKQCPTNATTAILEESTVWPSMLLALL